MKNIIRKIRAFTLIELLVVIAIIGILVSILVPAVTRGLEKARLLKLTNNGKNIYTALFAADAADWEPYAFPDAGDAGTSTEYFRYIVTNGIMRVSFDFFSGPGTAVQKTVDPNQFTAAGNAWNVVLGIGPGIDGAPFLVSRNLVVNPIPASGDLTTGLVAPASQVLDFGRRYVIVTRKGGGSEWVETNKLVTATHVNPTGSDLPMILP